MEIVELHNIEQNQTLVTETLREEMFLFFKSLSDTLCKIGA